MLLCLIPCFRMYCLSPLTFTVALVRAVASFFLDNQFLVTTFREQRRLFDDPISELRIGIFSDNVVTVHEHACLSEVLDLLEQHRELLAPQLSTPTIVCLAVFSVRACVVCLR